MSQSTEKMLAKSRESFLVMSTLGASAKQQALEYFAKLIKERSDFLISENQKDLQQNKGKISEALYGRLKLDQGKILQLVEGISGLAKIPDPVGQIQGVTELDTGLILKKVTVPLGVVGVIFESRPDVIPQVLSLILKSGNAAILKGGKEALHSNRAFMELVRIIPNLPPHWATLLEAREEVHAILNYPQWVDLVIPRGSNQLVRSIQENTKIPVLGHADGICHLYIDKNADLSKALRITIDSKCQYPSACNAIETLLVHQDIAEQFLKNFVPQAQSNHVELRACPQTLKIQPKLVPAKDSDFGFEFGDLILAVKIVNSIESAIHHIHHFGSKHTDAIVSEDPLAASSFLSQVDSADVFANASTRFADGFRFGLGAEVGISTSKTHARGPVGIEGLMTYKYQLTGSGQIVADYSGSRARKFSHKKIR